MADTTWDWWFGDVPPRKTFSRTRLWLRSKSLRRWLLSVSIASAASLASPGSAIADTPDGELIVTPVSLGWAASSQMILVAPQSEDDSKSSETETDAEETDAASVDEKRRERLRELLRQDNTDELPAPKSKKSGRDSLDLKESNGLFADPYIEERLPEVEGGRFILPSLRAVSIAEDSIGNGKVPKSLRAGEDLTLVPLPEDAFARSVITGEAAWPSLVRAWAAPNTFSHPLYFEDRMLERHGHERWGCLQPIASGARFFATLPVLPYLSTVQSPCEFVYSKGYFRSGSPVPRFFQRPPLERRAVIIQAAATAGGFIAIP